MPKRRSLVGTASEAMGDARKVQHSVKSAAKAAPKKHRPDAPKPKREPVHEAPITAAAPEPPRSEPAHERMPKPASAYEAMLGFANAALRQNPETGARLAQCKSPLEVVAAQTAHAAALTQSFIAASLQLMQAGLPAGPWALRKPRADSH